MTIKIVRNDAGNCVNFIGTTNPAYWNACLSAVVDNDDATRINVINDVRTVETGETVYEFYKIPYTEFIDADGNAFADATSTALYISEKANVLGSTATNAIAATTDTFDFSRDATNTTILMDNGDAFAVNSIKAVNAGDGTITIKEENGIDLITNINHENVTIAGSDAGIALDSVVNNLNGLFTVSPIGAGGTVTVPTIPTDGGVEVTGTDREGVTNSITGGILRANPSDTSGHGSRFMSTETINGLGEYYTFKLMGEGQFNVGLGSVSEGDRDAFNTDTGSRATGVKYGQAIYNYGTYIAPWTWGGRMTGSIQEGWSGSSDRMYRYNTLVQDNHENNGEILWRVGINAQGYISVEYWDQGRSNEWVLVSRSSSTITTGEYFLVVKLINGTAGLAELPLRFATDPVAPTMNFRYIESPDGNFDYPIFATEEEAKYYDQNHDGTQGTGTAHPHTYVDDPSGTTWYMPDTGRIMNGATLPQDALHTVFMGATVTYVEIATEDDANFVPSVFSHADITQAEGTNINLQLAPQGVNYTTSATVSPAGSGLVFSSGYLLQGTLTDVGADTEYTVTVVRANAFGSSTGTFKIIATDETPVITKDTEWNYALDFSGSNERTVQVVNQAYNVPLRMNDISSAVSNNTDSSKTSNDTDARPWATACVLKIDGHNSNQHIWNMGEGTVGDNIYLRVASNRQLYFGWGHDGSYGVNECRMPFLLDTNKWYGFYVASKGGRFSASNATAANLADAFDIRIMSSEDSFDAVGTNYSTTTNWTNGTTGWRTNRSVTGDMTIGGRGSNRSFHGKVASFVSTTLRTNDNIPSDAEIKLIITDPLKWKTDYKDGKYYRYTQNAFNYSQVFTGSTNASMWSTQIWLMGDGTNDSYSNMIRNQVYPVDQNYTKLNLISMVSNDIQNVNINGLTE
nr:fiber Ig/hemolysin [uncultured Mediterranean phage uvMED]